MVFCPAIAEELDVGHLQKFAWIGLGSNVGDRAAWLALGRAGLAQLADGPLRISQVVESAPWGVTDQPAFLNQVVGLRPRLGPARTLRALQEVERRCARRRQRRYGPRTLDLDLLAWPTPVTPTATLHMPHPQAHARRFVLSPWHQLAPTLVVPGLGALSELLANCPDSGWLRWSA